MAIDLHLRAVVRCDKVRFARGTKYRCLSTEELVGDPKKWTPGDFLAFAATRFEERGWKNGKDCRCPNCVYDEACQPEHAK